MQSTNFSSSQWFYSLRSCARRPKFILCTGGNPLAYIPTYSSQDTTSSGLLSGNIWRNLSSWMPQRETSPQSAEDSNTFPGRAQTFGSGRSQGVSTVNSDSSLQARLLDSGNSPNRTSDPAATDAEQHIINSR
ncbi:RHOMBOID-like protein 15 [Actinidia rufa]|uniref:RHOMBOID-like protein 15 n=1 Tax=Actinidia rufa TaxID=165716 RepID=A0A7J0FVW1_9ERIC|nr:RHOMBOID-like protein 15 [Actinidia rufa]